MVSWPKEDGKVGEVGIAGEGQRLAKSMDADQLRPGPTYAIPWTLWPWASHLISLCLTFPICKMRLTWGLYKLIYVKPLE